MVEESHSPASDREVGLVLRQMQAQLEALERDYNALRDDFADLCDEVGSSLEAIRRFRREQALLHAIVLRELKLPGEAVLTAPPGQELAARPGRAGSLRIIDSPVKAARYIICYLLRLTHGNTVFSYAYIQRHYGFYTRDQWIVEAVTDLIVRGGYSRPYRHICAEFGRLTGRGEDFYPEPSYEKMKAILRRRGGRQESIED